MKKKKKIASTRKSLLNLNYNKVQFSMLTIHFKFWNRLTLYEKYYLLEDILMNFVFHTASPIKCIQYNVVQKMAILINDSTIEMKPKIEYPQKNVQYTKIKANSNWTLKKSICLVLYLNEPETILKLIIDTQFTDTLLSAPFYVSYIISYFQFC